MLDGGRPEHVADHGVPTLEVDPGQRLLDGHTLRLVVRVLDVVVLDLAELLVELAAAVSRQAWLNAAVPGRASPSRSAYSGCSRRSQVTNSDALPVRLDSW